MNSHFLTTAGTLLVVFFVYAGYDTYKEANPHLFQEDEIVTPIIPPCATCAKCEEPDLPIPDFCDPVFIPDQQCSIALGICIDDTVALQEIIDERNATIRGLMGLDPKLDEELTKQEPPLIN